MFTTTIEINNTEFVTNLKGNLVPVFYTKLNEDMINNKLDINALIFSDTTTIKQGYGTGAKLEVEFDKNGQPDVKSVVKVRDVDPVMPFKCPTCGDTLIRVRSEACCPNLYCQATSRGFLYRFIGLATGASLFDITEMLDNYPIGGPDCGEIDTLEEFKLAFDSMEHKNTQARVNHWTKTHGVEFGTQLWEIELAIGEYLASSRVFSQHFWITCNFKNISESELRELWKVNPKDFIHNFVDYTKLSDRPMKLITHNIDFVMWLVKFFENGIEKTWITSEAGK